MYSMGISGKAAGANLTGVPGQWGLGHSLTFVSISKLFWLFHILSLVHLFSSSCRNL